MPETREFYIDYFWSTQSNRMHSLTGTIKFQVQTKIWISSLYVTDVLRHICCIRIGSLYPVLLPNWTSLNIISSTINTDKFKFE